METREEGERNTLEWKMLFFSGGKQISPWHDITLLDPQADPHYPIVTYVNEIPKGTRAKMEVNTKEPFNPIKQDVKNGALRFFKYGDIPFNYGMLPQTWENPHKEHKDTGFVGDNDPLDVVELSSEPLPIGAVVRIKVLGLLALIDEEETDWKILGVNIDNPMAQRIDDNDELDTYYPDRVTAVREWFRKYKTPDGKPENQFAFNERIRNQVYAMKIIQECHQHWKELVEGNAPRGKLWLPSKN